MVETFKPSCYELYKSLTRILQLASMYGADVRPENKAALEEFTTELRSLNHDPVRMMNTSTSDRDCTYVEAVERRVAEWKRRFPDDDNGLIGCLSEKIEDLRVNKRRPQRGYPKVYSFPAVQSVS